MAHLQSLLDPTYGPLVTVAIPTFNRAPRSRHCLISALSQTYRHFEVLASDNVSTDGMRRLGWPARLFRFGGAN